MTPLTRLQHMLKEGPVSNLATAKASGFKKKKRLNPIQRRPTDYRWALKPFPLEQRRLK